MEGQRTGDHGTQDNRHIADRVDQPVGPTELLILNHVRDDSKLGRTVK